MDIRVLQNHAMCNPIVKREDSCASNSETGLGKFKTNLQKGTITD
jgi:hypothetical protein